MEPSQEVLQVVLGLLAGLGLAAACGFRVFVPMLIVSIGVHADVVHVAPELAWIGSTPALVALAGATLLEIGGYYLPGLDHFLDLVATPSAVVAGAVLSTAFVTDVDPWFRWSLAMIVGGSVAGVVQVATVGARAVSGVTTLGLANPVVATGELAGATGVSILAIVAPVLGLLALVLLATWVVLRWRRGRATASSAASATLAASA
jgi:hypothetical protein